MEDDRKGMVRYGYTDESRFVIYAHLQTICAKYNSSVEAKVFHVAVEQLIQECTEHETKKFSKDQCTEIVHYGAATFCEYAINRPQCSNNPHSLPEYTTHYPLVPFFSGFLGGGFLGFGIGMVVLCLVYFLCMKKK